MVTYTNTIPHDEIKNFITLDDEKVILVQRKHWVLMSGPIIILLLLFGLAEIIFFTGLVIYLAMPLLFAGLTILFINVALSYVVKIIIGWHGHLYIVTTKRIMEVHYVPFSSYHVNDLLLDQMSIAEIEVDVGNIFNELMGKGDVIIHLNQYAHESLFTLRDVDQPRKMELSLTQAFGNIQRASTMLRQPIYRRGYIS